MFVHMKLIKGHLSWLKMYYEWPRMGGTYLQVLGCLGAALVDVLGGVIDFNTADGL